MPQTEVVTAAVAVLLGGGLATAIAALYRARAERDRIDAETQATRTADATSVVEAAGALVERMQSSTAALVGSLEPRLRASEQEVLEAQKAIGALRERLSILEVHHAECLRDRESQAEEIEVLRRQVSGLGGRRKSDQTEGDP